MRYAKLGKTGLKVSRLALGCMTIGDQTDEAASTRIIQHAFDKGVTLFDTAPSYVRGRSEEILGKALKSKRDQAVLATKVRGKMGTPFWAVDLSRKHIIESVEASLRRLQTDFIDLLQLHRFDDETPLEETLSALDDMVRQGKVRYVGCSNFAAWQLCKALWVSDRRSWARLVSVQPLYNMSLRYHETELLPLCEAEGVGVICYNPIGGGFLTGKYVRGQQPAADTRFALRPFYQDRYWSDENFDKLERVKAIAVERGRSLVDTAIGYVLKHPAMTSAIVGVTSMEQLDQSLKAVDVDLSDEECGAINQLWPPQGPPGMAGEQKPKG